MMRLVLVGAAVSALLVSCNDTPEPPTLSSDLRDLCKAIDSSVDQAAQERAFFDRAHDALHTLAERITQEHPDVAAQLLEAKERVESNLRKAKRTVPATEFMRLIDTVDEALAEIDAPPIGCNVN